MLLKTGRSRSDETALREHLFDRCGGAASKAIKKPEKAVRFFVDGREDCYGIATDGEPFGWFCEIAADVVTDSLVEITLHGNLPNGGVIETSYESLGGVRDRRMVTLQVSPETLALLRELTQAIRSSVASPSTKQEKLDQWNWTRTADSLDGLAGHLADFWRDR